MNSGYSIAAAPPAPSPRGGLWLRSRSWDLTFVSLSAVLVAVPLLTYYSAEALSASFNRFFGILGIPFVWDADASRNLVNGFIALFIGGPHMYATYTRTALEPNFTRKHRMLIAGSLLIPVLVIYFGVTQFRFLITFFFFWASIHIIHQATFVVECYNRKDVRYPSLASRMIDFALLGMALYPIATYKFIHGTFTIGSINIFFPDFLKTDAIFYIMLAVFLGLLVLFIRKSVLEYRAGTANLPKILFISLTAGVAFVVPAFDNLDVAFQGFNTWHSFQYLGLTYYINQLRHGRGEIGSNFIDRISRTGATWKYYMFNVGLTTAAVLVISLLIFLKPVLGLSFDQCYYIVVLSFLLTHYLHDHVLFTNPAEILPKPA